MRKMLIDLLKVIMIICLPFYTFIVNAQEKPIKIVNLIDKEIEVYFDYSMVLRDGRNFEGRSVGTVSPNSTEIFQFSKKNYTVSIQWYDDEVRPHTLLYQSKFPYYCYMSENTGTIITIRSESERILPGPLMYYSDDIGNVTQEL